MTKYFAPVGLCLLALAFFKPAVAERQPVYAAGVLSILSADTPDQVGAFENVVFEYNDHTGWVLRSFLALDERGLADARVEAVELVRTESFPVQVFLRASGPDDVGCATQDRIRHRRDGNHFSVQFSQSYDTSGEILCDMALRPFRKSVALPVYGLPAGHYTYDLNGFTGSFELAEDNGLAGDS